MAVSKTGGAFGFLRKSVGAVTYSTTKDKNNRRIQVVRQKISEMTNPNTIAQILQRMKVTPAQRFFAAINGVDGTNLLEHSWEGVKYGGPSRREFFARAMKATGPYIPKGVNQFLPAMYQISAGGLSPLGASYLEDAHAGSADLGKMHFETDVVSFESAAAAGSAQYKIDALAALAGAADNQLTLVWVTQVNGIYTPHIWRVVPSQLPSDVAPEIPTGLSLNAADGSAYIATPGVTGGQTETYVAFAAIRSAKDASGSWLRSDATMVLSDNYYQNLYGNDAMLAAIASYQSETSENAINSDWYLNLANGQAFPGSLNYEAGGYSVNGVEVNPVLGTISVNGRAKTVIFTDDGTSAGKVIGNSDQTSHNIGPINDTTGAGLVAEMMLSSYQYEFWKWQDKYEPQVNF